MQILAIMGSPRIKGNTDLLVDEAIKGAEGQGVNTEKILVDKLKIAPCREYYGCTKDGNCVIKDDMDDIYSKLLGANGVILASPMFFYGLTAQVKALIDRSQALWARRYVLKQLPPNKTRQGIFIAVGATKGEKLFEGSILTVRYFFNTIGVKYFDELLVKGIDKKGEIREHPTALKEAFDLGVRLSKAIKDN